MRALLLGLNPRNDCAGIDFHIYFFATLIGLSILPVHAFEVQSSSYNRSNGVFQLQFRAETNLYYNLPLYYALYRGTNVNDISSLIASSSGATNHGVFFDTNASLPAAFYRVRQIAVSSLTPPVSTIAPTSTKTLSVTLDLPAPTGGVQVPLTVSPAAAGVVPATLLISSGTSSASFTYLDFGTTNNATITAALGTSTATSLITMALSTHLVINEVDYDNIGTDFNEFVEIYNGGDNAVSLTNLALIFVNGANNTEYKRVLLTGTLAANGYLVVASSNVSVAPGAAVINFSGNQDNIQNGAPDGVALFDLVKHHLIDALSYEGSMAAVSLTGETGTFNLVEGTVLPTSVADSNSTAGSLIRQPNGQDTDDAASDWVFTTTITPGAANIRTP